MKRLSPVAKAVAKDGVELNCKLCTHRARHRRPVCIASWQGIHGTFWTDQEKPIQQMSSPSPLPVWLQRLVTAAADKHGPRPRRAGWPLFAEAADLDFELVTKADSLTRLNNTTMVSRVTTAVAPYNGDGPPAARNRRECLNQSEKMLRPRAVSRYVGVRVAVAVIAARQARDQGTPPEAVPALLNNVGYPLYSATANSVNTEGLTLKRQVEMPLSGDVPPHREITPRKPFASRCIVRGGAVRD